MFLCLLFLLTFCRKVMIWRQRLSRGRLKFKKGRMMRTSNLRIQPLLRPVSLHPLLQQHRLLQLGLRLMQGHITQLDRATSTCHGATSTCHGIMSTCHGATACAKLDTFWSDQFGISLTAPTSIGHNFHIRSPLEVHEYSMESLFRPLSNGSSLTSKFLLD